MSPFTGLIATIALLGINDAGLPMPCKVTRSFESARAAFHECSVLTSGVSYSESARALCVRGRINGSLSDDFESYLKLLERGTIKADYVVISGPGGEVRPAIKMANAIDHHGLNVVVGDMCASSCAQFLFMGGAKKIILSGGLVLFHGGPITEQVIARANLGQEAADSVRAQNKEMLDFYKSRNIDTKIMTDPPVSVKERLSRGEQVMWTWPAEKLLSFGVHEVYVEPHSEE